MDGCDRGAPFKTYTYCDASRTRRSIATNTVVVPASAPTAPARAWQHRAIGRLLVVLPATQCRLKYDGDYIETEHDVLLCRSQRDGMGMTHGEPNTYPRTADVVGYCRPEKALRSRSLAHTKPAGTSR
jgi:hypothetical protein